MRRWLACSPAGISSSSPSPRSTDEEEALLLFAHLRHTIDGFIRIELENDPWLAAGSWQRRLEWLTPHRTPHPVDGVLARRTVLREGHPSPSCLSGIHPSFCGLP